MMTMRNQMDRLFSDWLGESDDWSEGRTGFSFRLPLDVSETDDAYLIRASTPGMKPEDLDISVQNNTLIIRGEMRQQEEREGERWHLQERRYGQFQRTITLPNNVNADQVGAQYEDGVLTLTLPKSEEAKPRRISVSGEGQQQSGQQSAQRQSGQQRSAQQQSGQRTIEGQTQPSR
jgi:HSP20 family protein